MRNNFRQRLAWCVRPSRFFWPIVWSLYAILAACTASANPAPMPTRAVRALPTVVVSAATAEPATAMPTSAPTIRPTRTPIRPPTATRVIPSAAPPKTAQDPVSQLTAYESTVTFDAYPYERFWLDKTDPATHISFKAFDHAAYDAAAPTLRPQPKTFRAVVLENEFLRVTILPELGGRIFQITYKPTGQTLLYNNRVLKPTPWGIPEQNGWLAAGGIEWAFPTQEHGYEWNAPWDAQIQGNAQSISVILRDSSADDRPRVQVRVTLPAHAAYLAIAPRVENPTAQPQRIQFWTNALLNLGATGRLAPETQFFLPDDSVWVHSTGNAWIPRELVPADDNAAPKTAVPFSNLAGRDLRFYRNWDNYLGVFVADTGKTDLAQAFVGAYNYAAQLGLARIFSPPLTPGVKLFAWGPNFCCRNLYTDDGSEYFEMWGGMTRTFFPDDDVILPPGDARTWSEYFLPLPATNGVSATLPDFAMTLQTDANQATITAYAAAAREAVLILKQGDHEIKRWSISFHATQHLHEQIVTAERPLTLELQDRGGNILLQTKSQ
jgi:hypothetical protein